MSVDFIVPVRDDTDRSVPLPTSAADKFGYGLEFDGQGRIPGFRIDFDAMGEHLYQLVLAARQQGIGIERVIFDSVLQEGLFQSRRGAELRRSVPFMRERPWIRHDEHYHVDFRVPCQSLRAYRGG